ncbi:hypothetical protein AVEN_263376-1 [Araneus ventricosus]|uniref:Uncharacterized protein n=1 Tax=Araneus ventricosus TaxID=182803 RepID=A0A4Y2D3F5_ARAVE|nr:hypothetical protein AVEN_263376-1 [Araneus ventricosus]
MRACLKEDIGASPAEMVYGQCLRLPGEFFRNSTSSSQILFEDTFLQRLRLYTRRLRPVPTSHFIHLVILLCILIFLPHHMFLCVVIRLENRWSNRIRGHSKFFVATKIFFH